MSHQDTVDALVPNPWCLLQSVEGASKSADVSVFLKALWKLHIDRRIDITVEKGSDGIELVEFPSTQHGTRNDAADRIYSGHGREGFVIVNAIFLSVAFDDQSRFPNSICLRL
jgi:hypothetical protein